MVEAEEEDDMQLTSTTSSSFDDVCYPLSTITIS